MCLLLALAHATSLTEVDSVTVEPGVTLTTYRASSPSTDESLPTGARVVAIGEELALLVPADDLPDGAFGYRVWAMSEPLALSFGEGWSATIWPSAQESLAEASGVSVVY